MPEEDIHFTISPNPGGWALRELEEVGSLKSGQRTQVILELFVPQDQTPIEGEFHITAASKKAESEPQSIRINVLKPRIRISFDVIDGNAAVTATDSVGHPITGATVRIESKGSSFTETTDNDGIAIFGQKLSGRIQATVEKEGYVTSRMQFDISPPERNQTPYWIIAALFFIAAYVSARAGKLRTKQGQESKPKRRPSVGNTFMTRQPPKQQGEEQ